MHRRYRFSSNGASDIMCTAITNECTETDRANATAQSETIKTCDEKTKAALLRLRANAAAWCIDQPTDVVKKKVGDIFVR